LTIHKNSHENMDEHHLYEIVDNKTDTVFKYGICGRSLTKYGTSPRANEQVSLFNRLAGWARYFARILLTGISGRKRAEEIEDEYIEQYKEKYGFRPDGNPER
jgi:hypothetical protein